MSEPQLRIQNCGCSLISEHQHCPRCRWIYGSFSLKEIKSLYFNGQWWKVCRACSEIW